MRRIRASLLCAALGLSACGDGPAAPPQPPADSTGTAHAEVSARLRAALDLLDVEAAEREFALLLQHHGGRLSPLPGTDAPPADLLGPKVVRGALFEAAVQAARERISGPTPSRARAERALELAQGWLDPEVAPDRRALELARQWVRLEKADDLGVPLAPHDGPRVVALVDDFDLGEPLLVPALKRWQEEGAGAGLRVGVAPLYRGFVRVGIRRVRTHDPEEERRAVAARVAKAKLALEPAPDVARLQVGLDGQDMALFVVDAEGRIVARLAGRAVDPARLSIAVQRVGSR